MDIFYNNNENSYMSNLKVKVAFNYSHAYERKSNDLRFTTLDLIEYNTTFEDRRISISKC